MADERYEWLDGAAAERLLRGEPVEAADEHARAQAARLLHALDAASDPGYRYDDGELPGEAAAMAAFRKSRADAAAPAGDSLGTVRVSRPAVPVRTLRFGRPVRFGIAAAVAGFALGGVAVAAGTGVLPAPFGGDETPLPAASVSAAATPGPLVSDSPSGDGGGVTASPGAVTTPPSAPAPSGTPSGTPRGHDGTATPGGPGDNEGGQATPRDGERDKRAELRRRAIEACKDYRSGRIAPERKKRLEEMANGAERVQRFCDRLLSGGSGGGSNGDGDRDNDGSGDGDQGSDGESGSGGSDGSGSDTPPVSWTLEPRTSVSAPSASASLSAG